LELWRDALLRRLRNVEARDEIPGMGSVPFQIRRSFTIEEAAAPGTLLTVRHRRNRWR
jgi:hypothetical protein